MLFLRNMMDTRQYFRSHKRFAEPLQALYHALQSFCTYILRVLRRSWLNVLTGGILAP